VRLVTKTRAPHPAPHSSRSRLRSSSAPGTSLLMTSATP
jgi:hypothetical protein